MKIGLGSALAVIAAAAVSLALSSHAPDRPPGVSADHWAPISAKLGVVLVPDPGLEPQPPKVMAAGDRTTLIAPPTPAVQKVIEEGHPVRGYIMVKQGELWRPLQVVAPTVNN